MTRANGAGEPVRYRAGEIIFKHGEPSDKAYYLVEGEVIIYRDRGSQRVVLETVKPGMIFGEMGVLASKPRLAAAEAVEDSVLKTIDQPYLEAGLARSPTLVRRIIDLLMDRLAADSRIMETVFPGDLLRSLANLLDLLHRVHPQLGQREGLDYGRLFRSIKEILPVSQQALDRELNYLDQNGLIELIADSAASSPWKKRVRLTNPGRTGIGAEEITDHGIHETGRTGELDLFDLAELVAADPADILDRLPELAAYPGLISFDRRLCDDLINQRGPGWFVAGRTRIELDPQAAQAAQVTPAEAGPSKAAPAPAEDMALTDLTEVVDLDDQVIQRAIARIGPRKAAQLLLVSPFRVREKLENNMSPRMTTLVAFEMEDLPGLNTKQISFLVQGFMNVVRNLMGL